MPKKNEPRYAHLPPEEEARAFLVDALDHLGRLWYPGILQSGTPDRQRELTRLFAGAAKTIAGIMDIHEKPEVAKAMRVMAPEVVDQAVGWTMRTWDHSPTRRKLERAYGTAAREMDRSVPDSHSWHAYSGEEPTASRSSRTAPRAAGPRLRRFLAPRGRKTVPSRTGRI